MAWKGVASMPYTGGWGSKTGDVGYVKTETTDATNGSRWPIVQCPNCGFSTAGSRAVEELQLHMDADHTLKIGNKNIFTVPVDRVIRGGQTEIKIGFDEWPTVKADGWFTEPEPQAAVVDRLFPKKELPEPRGEIKRAKPAPDGV